MAALSRRRRTTRRADVPAASPARAAAVGHLGEHLQLLARQPMPRQGSTERSTESADRATDQAPHDGADDRVVDNGTYGDGIYCMHPSARVHAITACVGEHPRRACIASRAHHNRAMAAHMQTTHPY